jgi:hypothetical protein
MEKWIADGIVPYFEDIEFSPDYNISKIEFVSMINTFFRFSKIWDPQYSDIDSEAANMIDLVFDSKAKNVEFLSGYSKECRGTGVLLFIHSAMIYS